MSFWTIGQTITLSQSPALNILLETLEKYHKAEKPQQSTNLTENL